MRQFRSARAIRSVRIVLPSVAERVLSFCIVVLPLLVLLVLVLPSRCMRSVEEVPILPLLPIPVAVESWLRGVDVLELGVIVDDGFPVCPSRCIVPELPV